MKSILLLVVLALEVTAVPLMGSVLKCEHLFCTSKKLLLAKVDGSSAKYSEVVELDEGKSHEFGSLNQWGFFTSSSSFALVTATWDRSSLLLYSADIQNGKLLHKTALDTSAVGSSNISTIVGDDKGNAYVVFVHGVVAILDVSSGKVTNPLPMWTNLSTAPGPAVLMGTTLLVSVIGAQGESLIMKWDTTSGKGVMSPPLVSSSIPYQPLAMSVIHGTQDILYMDTGMLGGNIRHIDTSTWEVKVLWPWNYMAPEFDTDGGDTQAILDPTNNYWYISLIYDPETKLRGKAKDPDPDTRVLAVWNGKTLETGCTIGMEINALVYA